ncbi:unnamed protein product, partial [marine sediment metagenome]
DLTGMDLEIALGLKFNRYNSAFNSNWSCVLDFCITIIRPVAGKILKGL